MGFDYIRALNARPVQLAILLCFLFTLANPAVVAHGQNRYKLIVEEIEKPGKTKVFSEGDKLTLRSSKTGNKHKGLIKAFSDSSLVLDNTAFLFTEIQYLEARVKVPPNQRRLGLIVLGSSLVFTAINLMNYSEKDNAFPLLFVGPSVALISGYILFHKPAMAIAPQTGWQLRVVKVE